MSIGDRRRRNPHLQGKPNRPWASRIFLRATVFTDVRPEMRIAQEEIFGPVLDYYGFLTWKRQLRLPTILSTRLSSAIYTGNIGNAFKAIERIKPELHILMPLPKEPKSIFLSGCERDRERLPGSWDRCYKGVLRGKSRIYRL